MAMPRRRIGIGAWSLTVAAAIAIPLGLLGYLLIPPASDVRLDDAVLHFAVTTNVSLIAAAVSIAVMRAALDARHWPSVLVALGFMSLAGIFAVHGLATPGVLMRGGLREIIVAAAILAFATAALWQPALVSDMVEAMTGYSVTSAYGGYGGTALQADPLWVVAVSGTTVLLLLFSAFRQSADFARSRLPTHAALAIAFLFLAEAQVAMVLGAVYGLVFWGYHALMAAATILAIGALFLELDRRRGLERFLPPIVVERVVAGDQLSLEGQRRTATILFTDLRGSTALAERATPEAAVATVNAYLRAMARAVIDEGGILDKFTGDGLMAIFGAMSDPAAGAAAAARAALRMRRDIAAVNAERQARGEPVLGYGVGINTGDVVLGAVGLPERSDYTAMGDTVNTAARMESLTKDLGADVIVSEATAAHLDGTVSLRPLGSAMVKGKTAPVAVFSL